MPFGARNGRYFDPVITTRTSVMSAWYGQKGYAVAAGAAGGKCGKDRHVEEIIRALQHDGTGDGEKIRPEVRYMEEDEHWPDIVQIVNQKEGPEVLRRSATVERSAGHQQQKYEQQITCREENKINIIIDTVIFVEKCTARHQDTSKE